MTTDDGSPPATTFRPILYTFRRCPYAIRARLAIAVSGLQVQHIEVALRNKPADLLAASPKGTVPVLVLPGGEVIDESLDIMLWALRQNDPGQWLEPRSSVPDMLAMIAGNDGAFKKALDRHKYPNRYPQESAGDATAFAALHRALGASWLAGLEAMLGGDWLFGPRPSLADMALLPFVRQFAHTDPAWFAAQPWPRLQAWLGSFEASALFQAVMERRTNG
jgi:glutathione S-transferase